MNSVRKLPLPTPVSRALRLAIWLSFIGGALLAPLFAGNWPAWRGPTGDGISAEKGLPVKWSRTENVKWRVPLPERGNSTPIVWGDRVLLTQAVGERREIVCFNRADGKVLWQQAVISKGRTPTHPTNPYGAGSPVTDGERVIAGFGSDGLHCYDLNGKALWHRDLGRQQHIWGYGSSPVISGDLCFVDFGPGERSLLIAVDKQTGKTVWEHTENTGYSESNPGNSRDNKTYIGTWTTPVLMKIDGKDQVLMTWPGRLAAYEPKAGAELWTCSGLNPLIYTSPIYSGDTVVAMGGFGGMAMAVRAGGSGDITQSRRLWHHPRTKQRIGSGVIYDGHIYIHDDPNVAECLELNTGRKVWEERLTGAAQSSHNWSSVMLADGRCYTVNFGGDCFVFKASPKFELLSVNPLGEPSNSSIVPSNGELFIRTHKSLWCIGAGNGAPTR